MPSAVKARTVGNRDVAQYAGDAAVAVQAVSEPASSVVSYAMLPAQKRPCGSATPSFHPHRHRGVVLGAGDPATRPARGVDTADPGSRGRDQWPGRPATGCHRAQGDGQVGDQAVRGRGSVGSGEQPAGEDVGEHGAAVRPADALAEFEAVGPRGPPGARWRSWTGLRADDVQEAAGPFAQGGDTAAVGRRHRRGASPRRRRPRRLRYTSSGRASTPPTGTNGGPGKGRAARGGGRGPPRRRPGRA